MAVYKSNCSISGIGDAQTRQNEITADNLAAVRNFIVGYNETPDIAGVVVEGESINEHAFYCEISEDRQSVTIHDGLAFAYGYFGSSEEVEFIILPPAVEQYHIVYLEFDRSVIPNACMLKIKNNQASANWKAPNLFRQDQLSAIKTGVYQMPLWLLRVTNKGIRSATDLRNMRYYPQHVLHSDNANNVSGGGTIGENVTVPTADEVDISEIVANTEYVVRAVLAEINK